MYCNLYSTLQNKQEKYGQYLWTKSFFSTTGSQDLMQTEFDCTSEVLLSVAELLFSITQNQTLKPVERLFMEKKLLYLVL